MLHASSLANARLAKWARKNIIFVIFDLGKFKLKTEFSANKMTDEKFSTNVRDIKIKINTNVSAEVKMPHGLNSFMYSAYHGSYHQIVTIFY